MSKSRKLTPNLDPDTTKQINLSVLQRFDRQIEEILFTAAHVTLYEFNTESSQWARKDVEGPLFVVKRKMQPRFQFIVMNRHRLDNWVENLIGDFEFEIQLPYLLSRNVIQEVNGIWFYNPSECEAVGSLVSRILRSLQNEHPSVVPIERYEERPSAVPSTTQIPQTQNLMELFNAAINKGINTTMLPNHVYPPDEPSTISFPISSENTSVTFPAAGNHNPFPRTNLRTNLINPSSFHPPSIVPPFMPHVSSALAVTAPQPPMNLQYPRSIQLSDLFPPATTLPQSVTPPHAASSIYGLNRNNVRAAFQSLVQDDRFIDMFYGALEKPK